MHLYLTRQSDHRVGSSGGVVTLHPTLFVQRLPAAINFALGSRAADQRPDVVRRKSARAEAGLDLREHRRR